MNHILVVDDDESVLSMATEVLESEGYSVRSAEDGAVALSLVEAEPPSLVLLDMRLPKVNGWEFARRLQERGVRVPVVVMTAAGDAERAARQIGAVDYLAKPFDISELLSKVARDRAEPPRGGQ